jgi:FtsH-binding integral membrane protein
MHRFFLSKVKPIPKIKQLIEISSVSRHFARHAKHDKPDKYTTHHEEEHIIIDSETNKGPTAEEVVQRDYNLSNYLNKIYKTTGLSICSSIGLSYLLSYTYLPLYHPFGLLLGGAAMSLGGIFAFTSIPPNITVSHVDGKTIENWTNPQSRLLSFAAIIAGSGITLSPFLTTISNPLAVPTAIGAAILILGGSSIYALKKPIGHFKTWEATLSGGLIGLLGINLLSILFQAVVGPNLFTYTCMNVDMYVGLGLFTAFQAYDTNRAVREFQLGNFDHLSHVVQFFLNFKNLFIRLLSLFNRNRD